MRARLAGGSEDPEGDVEGKGSSREETEGEGSAEGVAASKGEGKRSLWVAAEGMGSAAAAGGLGTKVLTMFRDWDESDFGFAPKAGEAFTAA